MKKYNFACGDSKIPGYINVDIDEALKPDLVMDLLKPFPIENDSADVILFIHAIEHIQEASHPHILSEFHRILKPTGVLCLAYPEFTEVAKNYIENYRGMREFWKHTVYGRQLTQYDAHVALMDTRFFKLLLHELGFKDLEIKPEFNEPWNTTIKCYKGEPYPTYADVVKEVIYGAN